MEMRKIINTCHENAKKIINDNKKLLTLIAEALLEKETLTKEEIDYLVENGKLPEEPKEEVKEENPKKETKKVNINKKDSE